VYPHRVKVYVTSLLTGFVISVSYFRSRTFVYRSSDKVGNELIIVRDGVANIHLCYVPKPYITNYDGSSHGLTYPADLLVLNSNVKKNQRKKKSICWWMKCRT